MLQFILLFSLLKYSILQNPTTHQWDYQRNGPDTWPHRFDSCEGELQSPINIRRSHVEYDPNLHSLSLDSYIGNKSLFTWNYTHNGHTIVAYPSPLAHLTISGANLPGIFHLKQFHFHWGFNAYQGSEQCGGRVCGTEPGQPGVHANRYDAEILNSAGHLHHRGSAGSESNIGRAQHALAGQHGST